MIFCVISMIILIVIVVIVILVIVIIAVIGVIVVIVIVIVIVVVIIVVGVFVSLIVSMCSQSNVLLKFRKAGLPSEGSLSTDSAPAEKHYG